MKNAHAFLCIVPNYWGSGETLLKAKANMREAGGKRTGRRIVLKLDPSPKEITCHPLCGPEIPRGTKCTVMEAVGKNIKGRKVGDVYTI